MIALAAFAAGCVAGASVAWAVATQAVKRALRKGRAPSPAGAVSIPPETDGGGPVDLDAQVGVDFRGFWSFLPGLTSSIRVGSDTTTILIRNIEIHGSPELKRAVKRDAERAGVQETWLAPRVERVVEEMKGGAK